VTYELAVTQAPHASFANGGEDADARQPFLRYTQRTWNGPRIAAAVASLAPGDFTTVWANSTGDIFRVRLPSSGSTFDILDWTPHGVWDATTEQVLIGGRRGLTKIIGYSDVTGDWRELPMPAALGRFVAGTVHYYGKIARNPNTGVVYFGTSENDSRLFALTPGAETWEQLATAPTANNGNGGSFEWAADTERLVQYVGAAERWLIYNPGDNTWSNPYNGLGHGQHAVLRYHGTPERHLLVGGTDTTRRASLVTSAGVVTQVTDVPADIRMSAGSWIHAHPSGCWIVKTMDEPTPGTYDPKIYACWPNGTLDDVTWVDLGAAPDAALTDTTLIPGYSSDTVLIVSTSGLHAWRVPSLAPPGTSAITPAAGVATTSTLAGKSIARASITPAAGVATTSTLTGAGLEAGSAAISPAAGVATTATIAARSIARAAIVAASGQATTSTLTGAGVTPTTPTVTLRLFATPAGSSVVASATGIEWAWYDDATTLLEALADTPTVTGSGASSDASGYLSLTLTGSTKTTGERGFLLFSDCTGAVDENPRTFGAMVEVD
jgi:hypothetical protein